MRSEILAQVLIGQKQFLSSFSSWKLVRSESGQIFFPADCVSLNPNQSIFLHILLDLVQKLNPPCTYTKFVFL